MRCDRAGSLIGRACGKGRPWTRAISSPRTGCSTRRHNHRRLTVEQCDDDLGVEYMLLFGPRESKLELLHGKTPCSFPFLDRGVTDARFST